MKNFMGSVFVFLTGALFAVGLGIGGMTQADKVIGYLDFFGAWDPSLAVVMGASIAVHLVTWRLATGRDHPLFAMEYMIPKRTDIDVRLVAGAGIFGVGWGLGGYCPGPGIVSTVSGAQAPLVFVATMVLGMAAYHLVQRLGHRVPSDSLAGRGAAPTAK